jgi:enhancing lycopene biosynthesis protein 2
MGKAATSELACPGGVGGDWCAAVTLLLRSWLLRNGGHGAAASLVATAVQLRQGTVERDIHHLAMYH